MAQIILRSITPKNGIFDIKQFEVEAARSLNKIRDNAQAEFEKTTATWRNKPVFRGKKATQKDLVSRMWGNTKEWVWVNRGTKPHVIMPRRAPVLRFQAGFTSKTVPRKITSRRGGASGNWVSAKSVPHPGTEARDFDIVIAKQSKSVLAKETMGAIRKAAS